MFVRPRSSCSATPDVAIPSLGVRPRDHREDLVVDSASASRDGIATSGVPPKTIRTGGV